MMQIRLLPRTTLQILARPAAPHGLNGWTPVFAMAQDGDRRVQQVVNWIGGQGDKPATGWYVGPSGFVEDIAQAVDIRGITGTRGWSPVFAVVSDALRRVLMLSDWTGGTGTKPAITDNGEALYVGASGFTTVLADAIDIRGPQGTPGWSPVLAIVTDGERRVQQVLDWTGGEGSKPVTGQYVSSGGLTSNIAEATDIRGAQGATGPEWTPTNNSITNALLADMPANTLKGRTGTAGDPQDLSAVQAWEVVGPAGKASESAAVAGLDDTSFMTPKLVRSTVGWRIISSYQLAAPIAAIIATIPDDISVIRISGSVVGSNASETCLRISIDGVNFISGEQYYRGWFGVAEGNVITETSFVGTYLAMCTVDDKGTSPPIFSCMMNVGSSTTGLRVMSQNTGTDTGNRLTMLTLPGRANFVGRAKKIQLFVSTGMIGAGSAIIIEGM